MKALAQIMVVAVICMIVIGCSQSKTETRAIIKKDYYENGILKAEQAYLNDSVADGFFRKYYPSGKVQLEGNYDHNRQTGIEKGFYESGRPYSTVNYEDGLMSGLAEWYYEDGQLQTKLDYYKGNAVGEGYEYYNTGKLKRYVCRDFDQIIQFEMKFSEGGQLISKLGEGIVNIDINELKFEVGDTLKLTILVASPPESTYRMDVYGDMTHPDQTEVVQVDELNSVCQYERVLKNPGKFRFVGTYYITYGDGKESRQSFQGTYEVI